MTTGWLLIAAGGLLLTALWAQQPSRALPRLLLVVVVLVRIVDAALPTPADRLPARSAGADVQLTGTVCDFPRHQLEVTRFLLVREGAAGPAGVPERLLVSWYGAPRPPAIGERWRLTVRLKPPRGTLNPGAFDFEQWAHSQGIGAVGYVRELPPPALLGRGVCPLASLRGKVAEAIATAIGPRPGLAYLLGLSVGAYQALSPEEWAALRITGTVHLISISGFHIALVALPFAALGVWLARALLAAGVCVTPRTAGACTGLSAAIAYGALAGFTVPTLRSLAMLGLVTVMILLRRRLSAARVLGMAAVLLLLIEPRGPMTPGFWLSLGGVVLLVVAARLTGATSEARRFEDAGEGHTCGGAPGERRGSHPRRERPRCRDVLPRRPRLVPPALVTRLRRARSIGVTFLHVQLILAVGLAPLQMAWFGESPLAAGLANLVAIPWFSLVLLPLILTGTAVLMVWDGPGTLILRLAAMAVEGWLSVNGVFAELPAATLAVAETGPWHLILALLSLGWLLAPRPWPLRWLALPFLMPLVTAVPARPPDGGLEVRVLDVGQGTAMLVRTRGHDLLYDTGAGPGTPGTASRLLPVLAGAGVRRLDAVVISHADRDHAGEAAAVLARYPHARFWSSGFSVPGRVADVCGHGVAWHWDGYDFRFLHPASARRVADPGNDDSCVLEISGAAGRVLLAGDISSAVEAELAAAGLLRTMDLVLVPHHGSATSSSAAFVEATRPRYAVVSAAFGNQWGFPRPPVLRRWLAAGACVPDTATGGQLVFRGDGSTPLRPAGEARRNAWRPWHAGPQPGPRACRPAASDRSPVAQPARGPGV